jgi:pyruvate dehydrogenase E1 component alpha subunit
MDVALRQPSDRMSRFAEAHKVMCRAVDGNDVLAVAEAATWLIDRARAGGGPGFLEAVTYRWRGHVGPREDIDVGLRRSAEELTAWKRRDPIARLAAALRARGELDVKALDRLQMEVGKRVTDSVTAARAAAWPDASALLGPVYVAG